MSFADVVNQKGFSLVVRMDPPKGGDLTQLLDTALAIRGRVDATCFSDCPMAIMRMNRPYAQGPGSEKFRLDRQPVAIPGIQVQDGVHLLLLEEVARGERVHAHDGHGAVGEASSVDTPPDRECRIEQ